MSLSKPADGCLARRLLPIPTGARAVLCAQRVLQLRHASTVGLGSLPFTALMLTIVRRSDAAMSSGAPIHSSLSHQLDQICGFHCCYLHCLISQPCCHISTLLPTLLCSHTHGSFPRPSFTGSHGPTTRHSASLSGPARIHLPGHVPFTRVTHSAHATTWYT